jgi:ParB-like chromosome segregation protein Spo0J
MPSAGTKKRLSRIRRRAAPEVQAAFEAGKISARKADTLLYLPEEQQRAELERILSQKEDAVRRSRIATAVIREYVQAGKRDLAGLRKDLQLALSTPTIETHA